MKLRRRERQGNHQAKRSPEKKIRRTIGSQGIAMNMLEGGGKRVFFLSMVENLPLRILEVKETEL